MAALLSLILLIVVCPLLMFFMMRGMHGHGSKNGAVDTDTPDQNPSAAQLRELRRDLEARLEDLDARIEYLEAESQPSRHVRV
ncbi:MAG: DUF2933 domain-containing protein [Actinobacteria bacterium]|nr:DUF2933 domain-containing protein [Actinomycetota bacterium]